MPEWILAVHANANKICICGGTREILCRATVPECVATMLQTGSITYAANTMDRCRGRWWNMLSMIQWIIASHRARRHRIYFPLILFFHFGKSFSFHIYDIVCTMHTLRTQVRSPCMWTRVSGRVNAHCAMHANDVAAKIPWNFQKCKQISRIIWHVSTSKPFLWFHATRQMAVSTMCRMIKLRPTSCLVGARKRGLMHIGGECPFAGSDPGSDVIVWTHYFCVCVCLILFLQNSVLVQWTGIVLELNRKIEWNGIDSIYLVGVFVCDKTT